MRKLIYSAVLLLGMACAAETAENLLKNGGFDDGLTLLRLPQNWGNKAYNQNVIRNPFDESLGECLQISRKTPGYSIGTQIIDLEVLPGSSLTVSGYWQGKNIKINNENWNGAKTQIIFLDSNDAEIGQPYDLAHSGTDFEWQMFIQNVLVPNNAVKAKILIGLWDAAGEVIFDELHVYAIHPSPVILQNGDFETWGNWEFLGEGKTEIRKPGYGEGYALYVQNEKADWTFGAQVISLNAIRKYKLNGRVNCKIIQPGQEEWQRGRIYVEYFDAQMQKIGELNALNFFENTSGWKKFKADFTPPDNAKFAKLYFGLQNCIGEIAFDNLELR